MTTIDDLGSTGYIPGTLGRVTELHAVYYAAQWGLPLYFETKAAVEMAAFFQHFDPQRDGVWLARDDEQTVGAIFIDGSETAGQGARLRWFILDPAYHGQGLGSRLMDAAMTFCQRKGYTKIYLTTFAGLDAARHLYDKAGFKVTLEEEGTHLTGKPITEQRLELITADGHA